MNIKGLLLRIEVMNVLKNIDEEITCNCISQ